MKGDVVGWGALGISLVFVAIALVITEQHRLRLWKPITVAVARSLAQMAIVGAALVPIVKPSTPLVWSSLWVVGVVLFASVTTARRAPDVPGLFWIALTAMGSIAVIGLGIVFGLGVVDLNGRTLVPIAGMIIGNTMKSAVVGATRMTESVADHRAEIEAGLALGMSPADASRRFVRSSLRTAISPQVETTAALGVVFLPGAMTGLILAGADPIDAVRTQLALMYVILAGTVIGATITGVGTMRRLATADERILVLERETTSTGAGDGRFLRWLRARTS